MVIGSYKTKRNQKKMKSWKAKKKDYHPGRKTKTSKSKSKETQKTERGKQDMTNGVRNRRTFSG